MGIMKLRGCQAENALFATLELISNAEQHRVLNKYRRMILVIFPPIYHALIMHSLLFHLYSFNFVEIKRQLLWGKIYKLLNHKVQLNSGGNSLLNEQQFSSRENSLNLTFFLHLLKNLISL